MEQIERIGANGLFSILKGGYSSDRVHRWDSNSSANVIERKKKKKNNDDKPPKILYTPMGNKR